MDPATIKEQYERFFTEYPDFKGILNMVID